MGNARNILKRGVFLDEFVVYSWSISRYWRILLFAHSQKNKEKCSLFYMKTLRVLQKARIKIVARAIYTYLFFPYTYNLFFCWKIKSCDRCFPQQIRPQITVQLYILRIYSSVRIGFRMISKCHTLLVVYTILI